MNKNNKISSWMAILIGSLTMVQMVAGGTIKLGSLELLNGFEARKVIASQDGATVMLDARVFKYGKERSGVLTSDVLDLGVNEGIIALPTEIKKLSYIIEADLAAGATVALELRSGASFFDQSGWSPWQKLEGLSGAIEKITGRYFQARLTLGAEKADALPAVRSLTLTAESESAKVALPKVVKAKIEEIVRSPIEFIYERQDQPEIARFRKEAGLDKVVEGAKDDFEKLVRLMDWVASCHNDRTLHKEIVGGSYAWDINKVFELVAVEKEGDKSLRPTIYGHCMSYSEVLVTAATAFGYKARHMAEEGFRQATHEVTDIWVPSLGKWVHFDPSLSNYYYDKESKVPLNLIEMHKIVADTFIPKGKDTTWFRQHRSDETREQVTKIGGKTPIGGRLGAWRYGEPMDPNYDWGFYHGYLASGIVQMTPRNDFHTHPEMKPKKFGNRPGYSGYPNWVDEKTPPSQGAHNWYTRMRDFYWTLDQASMKLNATKESDSIVVEFGNSMPFFKNYQIKVNGENIKAVTTPFTLKLEKGETTLEVAPVDEFGHIGLASSVVLTL